MTPEKRDEDTRALMHRFSEVGEGTEVSISIAAAAVFMVCQCEVAKNPDLDKYAARKLRQVANLLDPEPVG